MSTMTASISRNDTNRGPCAMKPAPSPSPEAPPLTKVAAKTALEVCRAVLLPSEALALLRPTQTPRQFLDALLQQKRHADGVKFLAGALPTREAIWWACLCLRLGIVPPPPALDTALRVAVRWVLGPAETYRQMASRLAV